MLRCDRCGWECEPGTLVSPIGPGRYRQGAVHVCGSNVITGYGTLRVVEAASGTPEPEVRDDGIIRRRGIELTASTEEVGDGE